MSMTTQKMIQTAMCINPDLENPIELRNEMISRIQWISDKAQEAKVSALVLGISGGIDSTVTGRMCQIACENLRSDGYQIEFIAVRLPYNLQRDEADAQRAVDFISPDKCVTVNIAPSVDAMVASMGDIFENQTPEKVDFTKGNIKARVRMTVQYAIANTANGLVVGTDHSSESVTGFFTKYGDGGADIAPLFGLTKTQVRKFGAELEVPVDLITKHPTADLEDLNPGKKDEDAHGCTYEDIDAYLMGKEVSSEVAKIIETTYRKTQHKRELPATPVT